VERVQGVHSPFPTRYELNRIGCLTKE
jgi:hypothetical protein